MNNMFKKSLVAVAVLGFSSSALAADLVNTPEWVSSEYVATAGAEVAAKTVTVELSTNYADNDTIRVQFSGAFPTSVTGGDIRPDASAPAGAGNEVIGTASVISYNAETGLAILRATGVTGNTSGNEFNIGANFDYADVTENTTVSYQAYLGNSETTIGSSDTATIFGVASQFASVTSASADRLTATIDVSAERKQFIDLDTDTAVFVVDGDASVSDDLPTTTPATTFMTTAGLDSITYTVTGNFSWLLDTDGDYVGGVITACDGAVEGTDFDLTATTVTFDCTAGATTDFFKIDVNGLDITIPTQTFTIGAEVAYTNADNADTDTNSGSKTLSAVNFGEWTLNGSDVFVSYVPYRGGISQVINITNRSSQDGAVSVVAIDEAGNEFELNNIATSEAGTITAIAGAINTALSNATGLNLHPVNGQASTKRYALRIITNAPEGDIEVYSAYNVGGTGARLVVNSSNGK